jgi:hypothetical protein
MRRKLKALHEACGNNYHIALQQISVDSMWRRVVVWLQPDTQQYILNIMT